MYTADHERMVQNSIQKVAYVNKNLLGYLTVSALAGVYLGLGICLILSVGAPFTEEAGAALKLVMAATFGIALTLVIFAGAELFTGNNMVCTIGALSQGISWSQAGKIFLWSLIGNLAGSLGIAWMIVNSGVLSQSPQIDLLMNIAGVKMSLPAWELFLRGILCNWLVCLAVWMAGRTNNEAAKTMLIFWCLLAFVGSGFEHSIANQSLLGMALLLPHGEAISWLGFAWNQFFVILGNLVGGGVFVAGAYWLACPYRVPQQAPPFQADAQSSSDALNLDPIRN